MSSALLHPKLNMSTVGDLYCQLSEQNKSDLAYWIPAFFEKILEKVGTPISQREISNVIYKLNWLAHSPCLGNHLGDRTLGKLWKV